MNEHKDPALTALATLAHDFNNLLTPLAGILELLAAVNATEVKGFTIQHAAATAKAITRLSESIVAHYRGQIQGYKIIESVFSMDKVFKDLSTVFVPSIEKQGVQLTFAIGDPRLDLVKTDKGKVTLILFNLIHNAFKYTHEGTIAVSLQYNEEQGQCLMTVEDSGVGVPPDKSSTIFRVLEQGHEDSFKRGGVGIGLSLCRDLAEALGGTINLTRLQVGTSFTVIFPIELIGKPQSETPAAMRVQPFSLLVVDDSAVQRTLVRQTAESLGCQVYEASNGNEAIKLLEQDSPLPSIILMDGYMPGMNGPETVARIRSSNKESIRGIPIYALSGLDTDSQIIEFSGVEVTGHLAKPLRKAEFKNMVERHAVPA